MQSNKEKADIAYLKVQEMCGHEYGYQTPDQSFLDFMESVMRKKLDLEWDQICYIGTLLELEKHTYETAPKIEVPRDINLTDDQMRGLVALPELIWIHLELIKLAESNDVESLVTIGFELAEQHNIMSFD